MIRKLILTFSLAFLFSSTFSQRLKKEHRKVVSDFISRIRNGQWDTLADEVSFPLKRVYPVPDIKNKQEFLKRYPQVFDDQLIKKISNSNPDVDWSAVGWRGIMLSKGDLWLGHNGKLIAVNYQSVAETKKRKELTEIDRRRLHISLRNFASPVHTLATEKYRIRIDDLGRGQYRYASWDLTSKPSDKPSLVLSNGKFIAEGTGGNNKFRFRNQAYTYEIVMTVLGEAGAEPAMLNVYKGQKLILASEASIVGR